MKNSSCKYPFINRNSSFIIIIALTTFAFFALNIFQIAYSQTQGEVPQTKPTSHQHDSLIADKKFSLTILPFVLYNEVFGWAVGGFAGLEKFTNSNAAIYTGGLISTNGTRYGFFQFRNFYLPFFPRLNIEPDILGGYFGTLRVYKDIPGASSDFDSPAGSNESDKNNYANVSGSDQWYELSFRFLLPIGHGKASVRNIPILENGLLKSGETGGTHWNPLKSGQMFIDLMPFYRKRVNFVTAGIEFALTHENVDFYNNPTRGNFTKVAFRRDLGAFGSTAPWSVISGDYRIYLPLNEIVFNGGENSLPKVLALNIWTANTLTWNDYHIDGTNSDGSPRIIYHRPPPYTGAYLGGRYHMRAFYEGRFSDRAVIYYGAEYRQILSWNPFNYWSVTRGLNIQWLEVAFFAELGRVAPSWNISLLHTDMKWDMGAGIRIMMGTLVLRLDGAYSKEGFYTQMFVDHAF